VWKFRTILQSTRYYCINLLYVSLSFAKVHVLCMEMWHCTCFMMCCGKSVTLVLLWLCMTWLFGVIQRACRDLLTSAWYWYACNWCSFQINQSHLRSPFLFLMSPLTWTRPNSTLHNMQVIRVIVQNHSIEPWLTSQVLIFYHSLVLFLFIELYFQVSSVHLL